MDNFYTSPHLSAELREQGFGACGMVRINRCGLPLDLKKNLEKGDVYSVAINDCMLALKWADKHQVSTLSTLHNDLMVTKTQRTHLAEGGQEEVRKPAMVDEYNRYMGGVDMSDQLLSYYGSAQRTVKWWCHVFFH